MSDVLANQPELAVLNSLEYLTAHRAGDYELIAAFPEVTALIIVRVNSPLRTIDELRGKTIAFLPPSALLGHQMPRGFLLDHGLVAGRDYTVVEVANHDLTIDAVLAGKVDAAISAQWQFSIRLVDTRSKLRRQHAGT